VERFHILSLLQGIPVTFTQDEPFLYNVHNGFCRGGEATMDTMDGFAYGVMQVLTVVLLVGTIGLSLFVGKIWKKNNGY
jgi:hypothetical protein